VTLPAAAAGDPRPGNLPGTPMAALGDRPLTRIAFGSCARQDKEQPIWEAVLAAQPDLFIFLGDNIYADTRDPAVMAEKYRMLAAQPGFARLRRSVPVIAIWDDHDFGENDAGADYPMKAESKRQFLAFWGEPEGSARFGRDGVYASYRFGPPGRQVQVILPDLRWNRTPLRVMELSGRDYESWAREQHAAGRPVPGPYVRNPEDAASMLGEAQWQWLEHRLAEPADLRLFGSSLQVLADFPGWEGWINFAHDHQRLFETLRRRRAEKLIFLSGDTHYAELSRLDLNVPYPLWDLTSSGLTEVWPVLPPNARRVGDAYRDRNFGLVQIDWRGARTEVTLQIRDVAGAVRLEQGIRLDSLTLG
jgi:alkaline phosphatase D